VDTQVLSDDYLRNWLAANPGQAPSQDPRAVFGQMNMFGGPGVGGAAATTTAAPGGAGYTAGFNPADWNQTATGGYINAANPMLGYGLNGTPAPGSGWVMDNFGPPVWRRDYIAGPGGRPIIKGSDGYSGDYPLMSDADLAKWGITF
jgi:hypothetical protein